MVNLCELTEQVWNGLDFYDIESVSHCVMGDELDLIVKIKELFECFCHFYCIEKSAQEISVVLDKMQDFNTLYRKIQKMKMKEKWERYLDSIINMKRDKGELV